ncbi:MAG: protein kinase [Planctomycetaceae bacterium]
MDDLILETSELPSAAADAASDDIGGSTWIPDSEALSAESADAADKPSATVTHPAGQTEHDDDRTAGDSTWVPDEADLSGEVEDDAVDGTVILDGAHADALAHEAPEDLAQTYVGPTTDDSEAIDKTFVTDDLAADELASMNEAWKGDFDQESRPGMTIQSAKSAKSISGQRPRESLVIKSRTLSTADNYDPSSDEYELLKKLGEGGMGVVYHARQTSINRDVAVKMLKAKMSRDEEQRQKFLAEAVVTGDLDHPNIVPIYDVARNEDGALFYAMKKVQGTPWLDVIKDKNQSENLQILMRVADAVGFAHMRGVVHRDLKPENVMLGEFGEVLVMDWGLAQPMSGFSKGNSITETSTMGGTPAYMAPEMATGPIAKITPASDIYLLGAMLYEIVTGKPPHTGKNALKCLMAAAKNVIIPTDKTGELIDIAMQAMQTDISLRYANVQLFQDAIREFQSHTDSVAMSARAADDLEQAQTRNEYDDFSRALFGFQEAHELWDGNLRAARGVSETRLLYARTAFDKGDYDLGLSLLNEQDEAHAELVTRICQARDERAARQQRLAFYKRAGAGVAVLFLLVVSTAAIWINHARGVAVQAREKEEVAKLDAIASEEKAREAEGAARSSAKVADQQRNLAEQSRDAAEQSRDAAEQSRMVAEKARERARYEAYIARIGLAAAKIEENAFGTASDLLARCIPSPKNPAQTGDSPESDLRDWEWRRLMYLCEMFKREYPGRSKINALAIDTTGRRFVRGGEDGMAEIVDLETAAVLVSLDVGPANVQAVAFSPDGRLVATADDKSTMDEAKRQRSDVRLWDATSGKSVGVFRGHSADVLSIVFSRDGSRLLTASADHSARLWDVPQQTPIRVFLGHTWWVWSARFSPDERQLVTAGRDGIAIVWDIATGQPGPPFTGHRDGSVYDAVFLTPDPKNAPQRHVVASAGYDRRVLVWDPNDVQPYNYSNLASDRDVVPAPRYEALLGHTASVRSLAVASDGQSLLSGADDNTVKVWDVVSLKSIRTFRGHDKWVRACAFGPDGKWLLSGSHDTRVLRWAIHDNEEIRVLHSRSFVGHEDEVLSATFSANGDRIVTASQDRTAKTWDLKTGGDLVTFREGHEFLISSSTFFPDGRSLATAAVDNTVRIWDFAGGTERMRLAGTGRSAALAVSEDGLWIATGSDRLDGEAFWKTKLWHSDSGELAFTLGQHRSEVTSIAFSPDNRQLLTGDASGHCRLWDIANRKQRFQLEGHNGRIVAAAFLPDGRQALTASIDNSVVRWDVATGRELPDLMLVHSVEGHRVLGLDVSADGSLAVTACSDGNVRLFDVATAQLLRSMPVRGGRRSLAVNLRNAVNQRYADRREENLLRELEERATQANLALERDRLKRGLSKLMRPLGGATDKSQAPDAAVLKLVEQVFSNSDLYVPMLNSVSFSADGTQVLAANALDRSIHLWSVVQPQKPARVLSMQSGLLWEARFTPENDKFLTIGGNEVRVWDVQTRKEHVRFAPHSTVSAANFSPDGQRIVTAGWDNSARIWNASDGRDAQKLEGKHTAQVNDAVFSPDRDGAWVLTASDDGTAALWDSRTGEFRRRFTMDVQRQRSTPISVRQARFSPNGQRILTVSDDGIARLWRTEDGELLAELRAKQSVGGQAVLSQAGLVCGVFSPDGRRVAIGSEDSTARVWDLESGEMVLELQGHTATVRSVAFSPNGRRLLTGSDDYTVKLWDVQHMVESPERPPANAMGSGELPIAQGETADEAQPDDAADEVRASMPKKAKEILSLIGHTREVTSVVFSPRGDRVLTGSRDGRAILWLAREDLDRRQVLTP